jgi:hypothetical protein
MQYLGGLHGTGTLTCGTETVGRVDYDIDGYLTKPDRVTGSGEIRSKPEILLQVFGRKDVRLLTDDGHTLTLRFAERRLRSASDAAHVDVAAGLPAASEWRH